MTSLTLRSLPLPTGARAMRQRIRSFLADTEFTPEVDCWGSAFDADFSAALGAAGFLGMTWPKAHGGHELSAFERLVVNEELLAAGAPVAAHWFADRQVGPSLLKHGTEEQKQRFLPAMAAGTCFAAIGLSEPEAGSDLASVRTRAHRVEGGWSISGQKVWTSWAHKSHFIVVLARSAPQEQNRHSGLSQFIVELPSPGVTIRSLQQMSGGAHFNEVFFDDVFVPDDRVLGKVGSGWAQITGELAFERSGAERFLSPMPLLSSLASRADGGDGHGSCPELADPRSPDPGAGDSEVADLVTTSTARLRLLRQASVSIAALLDTGEAPEVEAAVIKDLGTTFEQEFVSRALAAVPTLPSPDGPDELARHLGDAALRAPSFTLRGGANDILRGIVAKGVGLR
ncbi:acyl-CoA dehydrogenase family protein [Bacillus subtilis]|nr:acyl-CoA dehydrogenase family protein [Bacillus subtilis]